MLINNTEALKSWLVVVLEPLCDADSSALARYVLALLKKDKPEKELKRVMIEQLDVFLGEETKPFVDRLFEAINSDEYLRGPLLLATKVNLEVAEDNTITNNSNEVKCQVVTNTVFTSTSSEAVIGTEACDYTNPMKMVGNETIINNNIDKRSDMEDNKAKDVSSDGISTIGGYIITSDHHQTPNSSNQRHLSHQTAANKPETLTSLPCATSVDGKGAGTFERQHTQSHRMESLVPIDRTNNADKENLPREGCRRRNSLPSKSRSRSRTRSNERSTRRSRSRDRRINDREKSQRQFRNKSPPPSTNSGDLRHERRRTAGASASASTSGVYRRRVGNNLEGSDTKSPRFSKNNAIGSRSANRFTNSPRSRSTSLERINRNKQSPNGGRYINRTESNSSPGELRHQHHENEKRQRCRDFDEKGYCVRGETCPWDHGVNPVVFEGINNSALISMSLREYNPDAPDLWSRSGPPTSMVVPPAPRSVMGSTNNVPSINPFAAASRQSSLVMGRPVGFPPGLPSDKGTGGSSALANFSRNSASVAGFQVPTPLMPFPFNPAVNTPLPRELIPIPVVDASGANSIKPDINASMPLQGKRRYETEEAITTIDGPTKRKVPAHSRLGPRVTSMQNCSLELRKIPRGLNTITHLNNHFAKFGKIVNIQISYDGDPEAAIITFSVHAEANVAYRSTEAVLNNRFIKVFWHTPENSAPMEVSIPVIPQTGSRKNSQYHLNNIQAALTTPTSDMAKNINTTMSQSGSFIISTPKNSSISTTANSIPTTSTNVETINKTVNNTTTGNTSIISTNTTSLRLKNNVLPRSVATNNVVMRKKQEEQVKAVNQLANGLRKRKQELLQNYVKQMKSTLELVERCEPSDPQRAETLATIKILQETIDKLRKEIALEQEQIQVQIQNQQPQTQAVKKTKEQQKKELLDIELELFAQQQEGNDTTAIQKRLEELQRSLGIIHGSAPVTTYCSPASNKNIHYSAGLTGNRNNIRARLPYTEGSNKVDRRPKTIIVTAFSKDESEIVLAHLKHYGAITKHNFDVDKNALIVTYATRNSAEQAITRGKVFKTKRLQIVWAPVISVDQNNTLVPTHTAKLTGSNISTNISTNTLFPMSAAALALASPTLSISSSPNQSQSNSETEMIATDTLPELRLEDEEEDEESEDRSWRR